MPTKLEIYNGALVTHLDTRPLRTLLDARTERRSLDGVWEPTLQLMLEKGMWNFASRSMLWQPSSTVTPEFGQRYAYEKPEDYVRLVRISEDEFFGSKLGGYLEEGAYFIADPSQIYVQYVSNDIAWGADPGRWPPAFTAAFKAELAWAGQGGVKPLSINDKALLEKLKKKLLADAQSKDVVNQADEVMRPGRLVTSRGGRGGYNRMRRTPYA